MNPQLFTTLALREELQNNLSSLGYKEMTAIQAESLPAMLAGKDVIAQAKTGSGKTAAFGLALLNKIDVKNFAVQSVIVCPTRELADQVATSLRDLARGLQNIKIRTLCGGTAFGPQANSLENGVHIVVGTPGRIEEHCRKETLGLQDLQTFVLDEADRMLDMGFEEQIQDIIEYLPSKRQTLLFSATYPDRIASISKKVMRDALMLKVESQHDQSSIQQFFYEIDDDVDQRLQVVKQLLLHHRPASSIIFCNTKRDVQSVCDKLRNSGFSVSALHGDLDQKDRDQTIVQFANKSTAVLVATDVAARGLDIESVDAIINFHVPRDSEVYIHRIGRTGRAGDTGVACSLYSDKESYKMALLEDYLKREIQSETLPSGKHVSQDPIKASMATLHIAGGKKDKVRAGDILGALTGEQGITGKQVGKINVMHNRAFVAVEAKAAKKALDKLSRGKLKGRSFKVRLLRT